MRFPHADGQIQERNFVEKEYEITDSKRAYQTIDKDFTFNVLKLVLEGTKSMNKKAEELGISGNTLSK